MKPKHWSYIFLAVVAGYFAGMAISNDVLLLIFKPLLVTSLLGYFISSTIQVSSTLKKWIIGALLFSIAGDTLLMFANNNELFFILGLIAFLIAHIFYIVCFHTIRTKEGITGKWYAAIIVAVYYFLIINFLLPHLGGLKYAVIIYGLVISFMLLIAMHLYDLKDNLTARYILTGAILFVVSDSVLAINKFYQPYTWGGWAIMITYTMAQWLLVKGCVRYILGNKPAE
ncbi:MAG TPA: lysoplasmalogenase [Niabella sp.]|nr:lysoplasmalogenase [Niabella sp.]